MSIFSTKKMQTQETMQPMFVLEEPIQQQMQLEQRQEMQEGLLLQNEHEVEREAAHEDMGVAQEQSRKKKKEVNIASRSKEEQHGSFSEIRRNAFQENLCQSISWDIREIRKDSSEEFISMLVELEAYARREQNGKKTMEDGEILAKIRKKLQNLFDKNEGTLQYIQRQKEITRKQSKIEKYDANEERIKREHEIIKRYKVYFDTFCSGQLTMTDPYGKQVDAVDRHLEPVERSAHICTMKDVKDMPLFIHEPSINDIHQKGLGDCYLEAAIGSLVAEHPERVKELMKDNGDGTVTVCLYKKYETLEDLPPSLEQICKSREMQNVGEMSNYDIIVNLFERFKNDLIAKKIERQVENSAIIREAEQELRQLIDRMNDEDYVPTEEDAETNVRINGLIEAEKDRIQQEIWNEFQNGVFQCKEQGFNALPAIDKIAKRMADDERFGSICDAIREIGGEYAANKERILDVISRKTEEIFTPEVMELVKTEYEQEYKSLNEQQQYAHYIRVKKEIPVDQETGKPLYTDSPLWVHMYQKAYAASGFREVKLSVIWKINELVNRKKKALEENSKLSRAEKQRQLKAYEEEVKEKYKYSYENIEGGHISEATAMLNNVIVEKKYQEPMTFKDIGDEVEELKKDANLTTRINECVPQFQEAEVNVFFADLQKRMEQMCETIKVKVKDIRGEKKEKVFHYTEAAITIEDMKSIILDAKKWKDSKFYQNMYQKLNEQQPQMSQKELEEQIKLQLQNLADTLERYYEQLEGRMGFQHKRFAEDADETGKYTQYAISVYEKIEAALAEKKTVGIGTKQFIDDYIAQFLKLKRGISAGETMRGGIAQRHAYSIIGCMEKQGHLYVALRNPWGTSERAYTKITRRRGREKKVSYSNEEIRTQGGEFYMELNDMLNSSNLFYGLNI